MPGAADLSRAQDGLRARLLSWLDCFGCFWSKARKALLRHQKKKPLLAAEARFTDGINRAFYYSRRRRVEMVLSHPKGRREKGFTCCGNSWKKSGHCINIVSHVLVVHLLLPILMVGENQQEMGSKQRDFNEINTDKWCLNRLLERLNVQVTEQILQRPNWCDHKDTTDWHNSALLKTFWKELRSTQCKAIKLEAVN